MPDTIYMDIMADLMDSGVDIVVDATKDLLMNVLSYKPFLIKPNNHELGEIFGVELKTREEVIPYARKLQEKGARNVLVSMAGEGAVLIDENGKEVVPIEPNSYKFESFIFDAFEFFDDIAILRGKREDDFAPVKNKEGVDSPKTAKELYEKYCCTSSPSSLPDE